MTDPIVTVPRRAGQGSGLGSFDPFETNHRRKQLADWS